MVQFWGRGYLFYQPIADGRSVSANSMETVFRFQIIIAAEEIKHFTPFMIYFYLSLDLSHLLHAYLLNK